MRLLCTVSPERWAAFLSLWRLPQSLLFALELVHSPILTGTYCELGFVPGAWDTSVEKVKWTGCLSCGSYALVGAGGHQHALGVLRGGEC